MPEYGNDLSQVINQTGLAEVVRVTESAGQISLLYRVKNKGAWLELIEYLLKHKTSWDAHICQQYFLRGDNMVYGWNFIMQAEDMEGSILEIKKLIVDSITNAPSSRTRIRGPISSFPLVGASPRRMAQIVWDPRQPGPRQGGPSHKGAHAVR